MRLTKKLHALLLGSTITPGAPVFLTDEHPALLNRLVEDLHPLEGRLTVEELARWLSPLGDREREILALRYVADLTTAEIARLLG